MLTAYLSYMLAVLSKAWMQRTLICQGGEEMMYHVSLVDGHTKKIVLLCNDWNFNDVAWCESIELTINDC
jgi:hypothetical protein